MDRNIFDRWKEIKLYKNWDENWWNFKRKLFLYGKYIDHTIFYILKSEFKIVKIYNVKKNKETIH